jgi:hypothetical protein
MGDERGQASVEFIALIALVAISLGAMARLARRADDHALGATLAHSVACAARDGCGRAEVVGIRRGKRTESQPPRIESFIPPPLVPSPDATRPRPALRRPVGRPLQPVGRPLQPVGRPLQPNGRPLLEWARRQVGRELARLLRRLPRGVLGDRAGRAWRSAWFACLVYERVRWAILHPESRSHEYELPPAEAIRMLNDCISPLDLVRDWSLITDR